ncbi:hypothetical protein [Lentilactobacillus sp. Marseille-Q4993]|uniref:hypothetical protein n=1 Tax=Lentilactobacillus sp. Marseille-Q4993 TaxID=3039492 RepID=UPI0024BC49AD|nr:hypothetical protein [Lentilactobacillus sp. Marseille-Q4993]
MKLARLISITAAITATFAVSITTVHATKISPNADETATYHPPLTTSQIKVTKKAAKYVTYDNFHFNLSKNINTHLSASQVKIAKKLIAKSNQYLSNQKNKIANHKLKYRVHKSAKYITLTKPHNVKRTKWATTQTYTVVKPFYRITKDFATPTSSANNQFNAESKVLAKTEKLSKLAGWHHYLPKDKQSQFSRHDLKLANNFLKMSNQVIDHFRKLAKTNQVKIWRNQKKNQVILKVSKPYFEKINRGLSHHEIKKLEKDLKPQIL